MKYGFIKVFVGLSAAVLVAGGLFVLPHAAHAEVFADIKANGQDGPVTIVAGTSATLSWTATGATSCSVNPGNFSGTSGSVSTGSLNSTQTYFLTCTGPNATVGSDLVTVNVSEAPHDPLPVIADIKASGQDGPITIQSGQSATLSWSSSNATSCTVNPGSFTGVQNSGTATGALTGTQQYMLICHGPNAAVGSDLVIVNVQQAPTVPTVDLKLNGQDGPVSLTSGATGILSWTSQNATTCNASNGWVGMKNPNGSEYTAPLSSNTTFTITCTGSGGTATDSVTVNVNQPAITADIKANGQDGPITIAYNTSANISWTSTGANSCLVSPDGFTGTSGSQSTGNLTNSRTYVLTCTNNTQTRTDSVTVNVEQQVAPTVTINANPQVINLGQTSVLTWTSQNATTCFANGGWSGQKSLSGSEVVTPSVTTVYSIVCTNSTGQSATAQTTVTVNSNQQFPTLTLTANPTVINQNQSSVLTWNSTNTTSCSASGGWSGQKSLSGSETVFPQFTTTYSMTCIGTNGQSVFAQATVIVNQQQQLQPTVNLTANPNVINSGQAVTLSWFSNNANSCSASGGWSGSKSLSGSEIVYPSFTTTYTITCVNNVGLATDSETVIVNNNQSQFANLQVTKSVRNVTLNQIGFTNSVEAQSLDVLEFEIRVRNNDFQNSVNNVIVRDILPQELLYVSGSTTVDGFSALDGITSGGISLGTLAPNQEKVVRFRATVFAGTTNRTITNQAVANGPSGSSQNGFANVNIRNRGQVLGVSDIVTGPEDVLLWVLVLGFLATLAMHFMVFRKNGEAPVMFREPVFAFAYGTPENVAEPVVEVEPAPAPENPQHNFYKDRLSEMLKDIRTRESKPDTQF